ncbi:hypothetical protein [Absidia glauca]|uniref:AN1-type domain-containing protein n=1 Tax=Absidia glauca TaxID=4829 RepID=A0A163ITQ4_ABSGL|nr:hypothetical protein [Absidia glauca]
MTHSDFLPINCPFCKKTFCGDHRLPLDHQCDQWSSRDKQVEVCPQCQHLVYQENAAPEETVAHHLSSGCKLHLYPPMTTTTTTTTNQVQCAVDHCQEMNPRIGPAHCLVCSRDFCLKYPSKHQCPVVDVKEQRRAAAQATLAKTFKPPTPTVSYATTGVKKPLKKTNPKVELMKIKARAKGMSPIPMESRLYLNIGFPPDSCFAGQQIPMYLDKYNRVGKTLDLLAEYGKVKNDNNLLPADHDQRLELYLTDQDGHCRLLEMSSTLEKAVESLDTLVLKRRNTTHTIDLP